MTMAIPTSRFISNGEISYTTNTVVLSSDVFVAKLGLKQFEDGVVFQGCEDDVRPDAIMT